MVTDMTVKDSRDIFGKTKEFTASSTSGIHYGHHIAACESDPLSVVNHFFMVIPSKADRPLSRRTNSLHNMIQKFSLRDQTRIIQLYEADFNTTLKFLLVYRSMKHGKYHGISGHRLYGSRKGKCSYHALITVQVVYGMARIQGDCSISLFNNLKGAYDRVRPGLNTVTIRYIGLSKEEAICHFNYRSIIGKLNFLEKSSRPDIAYAVH